MCISTSCLASARLYEHSHYTTTIYADRELRDTIALLQDKLAAAGDREIEHQRKLKVFARLDPIFSSLAEQFSFDSPDEVWQTSKITPS
jgi:hypothetical protein